MSINATSASSSLFHKYSAQELYVGTDFSSLNWVERQWVNWYLLIGDPVIATGLATFLLNEVCIPLTFAPDPLSRILSPQIVYFGRCVPWLIIDAIPYFRRWKLQPEKVPTAKEQWECTKSVLFSHFTVQLPLVCLRILACALRLLTSLLDLAVSPNCRGCRNEHLASTIPYLDRRCPSGRVLLCLRRHVPLLRCAKIHFSLPAKSDLHSCFTAHQFLHWGPMYKHIHKMHHKYSAPFGLAAEYAHPAEVLILGAGTITGPILYVLCTGKFHISTMHIWMTLRHLQAIDAHSGYDFPWSLQHILPFWAGAEHHDFHHMSFVNNFSTSFRWCDYIMGTNDKYHEHAKRVKAAKAAAKTPEELKAVEQRLARETEAEGLRAEAEVEAYGKQKKH